MDQSAETERLIVEGPVGALQVGTAQFLSVDHSLDAQVEPRQRLSDATIGYAPAQRLTGVGDAFAQLGCPKVVTRAVDCLRPCGIEGDSPNLSSGAYRRASASIDLRLHAEYHRITMKPIRTDFRGYEGQYVAIDLRTGKVVIANDDPHVVLREAKGRDHVVVHGRVPHADEPLYVGMG